MPDVSRVRALTFDVFGTVVDWRSSVIREGTRLGDSKHLTVDWARFADRWRAGYGPSMDKVRKVELPWTTIDDLHRMVLDQLVVEFGITDLSEADKIHFNRVWHRLSPWPDSVEGLKRLKRKFTIAALSNGNTSLLVNMAKNAGLPWDWVLSAELVKRFKPDREVYLMAADKLGLKPDQVMMVAAHKGDLKAALEAGLHAAFVPRPLEHGPGHAEDATPDPSFDVMAKDFLDLAAKLGA
ncbi:MAG: haloacid dehalogenase type II [Bryobacteraceae bacterium]